LHSQPADRGAERTDNDHSTHVAVSLEKQSADDLSRMIHEPGDWWVERAADAFIVSLATADGFEKTFAMPTPQADQFGKTLRESADRGALRASAIN
jgi:hypothetical protein